MKGRYAECGFTFGNELPDHVTVILRFLAYIGDSEESKDLTEFCLMPALNKMIESLGNNENPYALVLQALVLTIRSSPPINRTMRVEN